MIALTVRQPYASRIVFGVKTIENRSRPTKIRGLVAIHAGAQIHERFSREDRYVARMPRSSVVGVVQIVGSHLAAGPECKCSPESGAEIPEDGEALVFHWVLSSPKLFESPIPRVRGALGFWHLERTHEYLVEENLAGRA